MVFSSTRHGIERFDFYATKSIFTQQKCPKKRNTDHTPNNPRVIFFFLNSIQRLFITYTTHTPTKSFYVREMVTPGRVKDWNHSGHPSR